jgi:hypothetical protein
VALSVGAAPGPNAIREAQHLPEETIRIMCPNLTCRRVLAVPVSARGRTVRCKGCTTNIRIPAKREEPAKAADVAPAPVEAPAKKSA